MSHYGIPVGRSCGSYRPGHEVHWIHAKKAGESDQPLVDVSITFRGHGWVEIQGEDLSLMLWSHEAAPVASSVGPLRACGVETTLAHAQPAGT